MRRERAHAARSLSQARTRLGVAGLALVGAELEGEAEQLSGPVQGGAYCVVAEALTTPIQHSRARELGVCVFHRKVAEVPCG